MNKQIPDIRQFIRCPICRNKRNKVKATVLKDEGERLLLHITCEKCLVSSLSFISWEKLGIASFGVATDLGSREAREFLQRKAISVDYVLDVHNFLEKEKQ